MNKSDLKKYAPQARKDFIAAVTRRAQKLGLDPARPAKVERSGDVLLIDGQPYPAAWAPLREKLQSRIRDQGFEQVMDAMAYTWFNRLVAIRYMELHGFLDHGYRVLSHPVNKETGHTQPEILDHIAELDLPGLDRSRALDLKLAGNRDEELYRNVLLAQCRALHTAMPFLFESLDDATELLLPDGLLRTDSILGKLVTAIDEADWQDVEVIGWLYQFYISEKKDQVIGKVVKSEDIPAATQLFTPNWIVKYLVQNSLGRLWLMANPTSTLATKWEYYIQPAEQTPEVNAQLDALIQARIAEDGATLNPESLTLLDPACGSGHILVEAYDLLRDIYLERGYRRQDIPRLILEKNLYGLDIDDRAAQLAGFALLTKARADDRRLLGQPVALNVLALQEAKEGSASDLQSTLNAPQIDAAIVSLLVETFEQAKTFGSLIQVPYELANALPELRRQLEAVRDGGDMLGRDAAETLLRLVAQADVLAKQFDAVVANPPYMGKKGMNSSLKVLATKFFPASKSDLYAMFVERGFSWCRPAGFNSMVTMQSWMFLSSFEAMRSQLLASRTISTMAHLGARAFSEISGEVVQTTAFVLQPRVMVGYRPAFFRLVEGNESDKAGDLSSNQSRYDATAQKDFTKIPGYPIVYWLPESEISLFSENPHLSEFSLVRAGLQTGDNERFLRYWHEVDFRKIGRCLESREDARSSGARWFPHNKGGGYRKWYGNIDYVIDWENDGDRIKRKKKEDLDSGRITANNSKCWNQELYFKSGLSWSSLSSGAPSFRANGAGFLFDTKGQTLFPNREDDLLLFLGLLNSGLYARLLMAIAPTLDFNGGNIAKLPMPKVGKEYRDEIEGIATRQLEIARELWDSTEDSWDFEAPGLLKDRQSKQIQKAYARIVQDAAQLEDESESLDRKLDQVVAAVTGCASAGPHQKTVSANLNQTIEQVREVVSFIVGCMMGRYSLDAPGLIYAHAGNEGFDPSRYETFQADDDGIVPITDVAWFDDDGANRIRDFVRAVWGEETEAENMAWLAESLGSKASESADDTIRRYLSRDFYKDHLQTYKKRPIYWLFSSGKHKAFEALVYLHRYNAGTLSRMRMEYVVPLQSRMQGRIDSLEQDIQAASSSAETKRLQKQRDKLTKQIEELRRFDETLRHYADQRITLDLDDGVKVNYGKFGDLLSEVKTVTGGEE